MMWQENSGQDSFIDMIDKLSVVNLSQEGEAILKSMADYIRAALEKGLLLEQIILKRRNQTSQDTVNYIKKTKKNKCKGFQYSDEELMPHFGLQSAEESEEITPELGIDRPDIFCRVIKKFVSETKPRNVRFKPPNVAPEKSLIKLVDQSSLLSPHLSNTLNTNQINDQCVEQAAQGSWISSQLDSHDNFHPTESNGVVLNQQPSVEPALNCYPFQLVVPKVEMDTSITPVPTMPLANSPIPDDFNSVKQNCSMPNNELPNLDQPIMPFPITIKSEDIMTSFNPPTDPSLSSSNQLALEVHSTEQNLNSAPEKIVEKSEMTENTDSRNNLPKEHVENNQEFKVFIEAGKEATEEEVCAAFKDLDIVFCRVINRPLYSFGFVNFSSEDHMKRALELSHKMSVAGKLMNVRPCHKERLKSKPQVKVSNSPKSIPLKRGINASVPAQSVCKRQKFSNQPQNYRFNTNEIYSNNVNRSQRYYFMNNHIDSHRPPPETETGVNLDNSVHSDSSHNFADPSCRTFYPNSHNSGAPKRTHDAENKGRQNKEENKVNKGKQNKEQKKVKNKGKQKKEQKKVNKQKKTKKQLEKEIKALKKNLTNQNSKGMNTIINSI